MEWFHFHKWKPVAADLYEQFVFHEGHKLPKDVTLVLYRCDCGSHKVERLPGHWKLEQLTAA